MLYVGTFGIVGTLVYVLSHAVLGGRTPAWQYASEEWGTILVLWDKVFIIFCSILLIAASVAKTGLRTSRLLVGAALIVVALAIIADDLASRSTEFSSGFLTLVLLTGSIAIPFRPWQVAALGSGMLAVLAGALVVLPAIDVAETASNAFSQIVFFGIVVAVLTGASSLMYRSRMAEIDTRLDIEAVNARLLGHARQIEQEKARSEADARRIAELESRKTRLFTEVSHEIRTPLTLILSPVQDALDGAHGPLDPALRKNLLLVRRNSNRILRLVNELLDVSKSEAGHPVLQRAPHDLHALLVRSVKAFRPLAERKGLTITLHGPKKPAVADIDATRIEKVIYNLLSNACKFTPRGGRIDLFLARGSELLLTVRDTGPGVPEDELPHLFERYHQVRPEHLNEYGTSGIGLSLSRDIVEMHGGSIRAGSTLGGGLEVVVSLPTHAGASVTAHDGRAAPAVAIDTSHDETDQTVARRHTRQVPRVLVVDDDEDMRHYLHAVLDHDYDVLEADCGRSALRIALNALPELIISDVMMSDMDGIEFAAALKVNPETRRIPIILLTARTTDDSRMAAWQAHVDDYILKPFSTSDLRARVENLIEIRRLLRAEAASSVLAARRDVVASMDDRLVSRAVDVIERHLDHTHFGVDWLADEVGLSPRQLQRRLRSSIRLSAAGLIRMKRLQRAANLLSNRAGSVSEVAHMVGFTDAAYFSRLFRQTYGSNPSQYALNPRDGMGSVDPAASD